VKFVTDVQLINFESWGQSSRSEPLHWISFTCGRSHFLENTSLCCEWTGQTCSRTVSQVTVSFVCLEAW